MKFTGEQKDNINLQSKALRELDYFFDVFKTGKRRKIFKLVDKQYKEKHDKNDFWIPTIDYIEIKEIELITEVMVKAIIRIIGWNESEKINSRFQATFIAQKNAYKTDSKSRFLYNPLSIKAVS